MSLALAFARIFPPGEPHRRFSIAGTFLFRFLFLATVIQVAIQCPSRMVEIGNPPALVCNVNALFGMRVSIVTCTSLNNSLCDVQPNKLFFYSGSIIRHFPCRCTAVQIMAG